jgi:hypothetical protein
MRFVSRFTLALVLAVPAAAFAQQPPQQPPAQPQPQGQQPAAQQPAQQQAAPADPGRKFTAPAGILFNIIKPEKAADFEAFLAKLHEAVQKSQDATRKQQAAGWKVYKMTEPANGNIMYVYFIDPAVPGADYTATKIIAETFPTEEQGIYEKIKDAFAGQSLANLTLVADFSKPVQ